MISHTYRCVFIHIPKTAGSSIETKLGRQVTTGRNQQDHRALCHIQPLTLGEHLALWREGKRNIVLKRLKYRLQGRDFLTPEQYRSYFKFSFVRNPWARVHSWYKNVMQDPLHQEELGVPPECSFSEFVAQYLDTWALRPQLYWLRDCRGNIPLDFIGRFERLQEDFARVSARLGLPDANLPHLIRSGGPSYREVYDERSRAIVARRYAEEIALFGYRFEGEA